MERTAAAATLADGLVAAAGGAGPYPLLVGLLLLTAVLGQLIDNTATALLVIPGALSAATGIGASPRASSWP